MGPGGIEILRQGLERAWAETIGIAVSKQLLHIYSSQYSAKGQIQYFLLGQAQEWVAGLCDLAGEQWACIGSRMPKTAEIAEQWYLWVKAVQINQMATG